VDRIDPYVIEIVKRLGMSQYVKSLCQVARTLNVSIHNGGHLNARDAPQGLCVELANVACANKRDAKRSLIGHFFDSHPSRGSVHWLQ
jgi:hypothetical protein